ncbi:hypothetical protein MKK84_10170 [Methylobacterium sp. E-065]|nr:hypothetical protein [Methylobacterium sp. E-065]
MGEPTPPSDARALVLQNRIAFSILLDECVIAVLSDATALMREVGDPAVLEFESAIRTYRVSILKQRTILGAAGIDV